MGPIDLDTHSAPLNEGPTADLEGKSRRRIATFFDGSYVADPNDYEQIMDERPVIQHARTPSISVADIDIDTVRDFVPVIDEDEVKPQPIGPTHSTTTVSFVGNRDRWSNTTLSLRTTSSSRRSKRICRLMKRPSGAESLLWVQSHGLSPSVKTEVK